MKSASPALKAYLLSVQQSADARLNIAECFTLTLASGTVVRVTSADVNIIYGGNTFSASSIMIEGLRYHSTCGLSVDQQTVTVSADPSLLVDGVSVMAGIVNGLYDMCVVQRDMVFFSDYVGGTVVGGVTMFHGRILKCESVGRGQAELSVADDLIVLANDMPRNVYSITCNHVLYDSGCGVDPATHSTTGTVLAGSTTSVIKLAAATTEYVGGYALFTSGSASGTKATIKNATNGVSIELVYPVPDLPAAGDTLTLYKGCDHTKDTCSAKFSNLDNFRGFPDVPPPQYAQ